MKILSLSAALFLGVLILSPVAVVAEEATFYFVRHAEKVIAADNPDPALTAAGHARAARIAAFLKDRGVTAIWSSDFIRTRDTAAPTAAAAGLDVQIYDPRDLEAFSADLKSSPGTIVVFGHSNTTPELAGMVSGLHTDPIEESVYDRIYEVRVAKGAKARLAIFSSDEGPEQQPWLDTNVE